MASDPDRDAAVTAAEPSAVTAGWATILWRGLCGRCPQCGRTKLFSGYLEVKHRCEVCGAPLGDMPADDTPVYVAMVIIMHIMAAFITAFIYFHYIPSLFASAAWLGLLILACCIVLKLVKGAVIGILLKLGFYDRHV